MKSYNQKSNAKRAASSLAAKFPGYTMTDPVAGEAAGEWFPALMTTKATIREGVPAEIAAAAYVNGADIGGEPALVDSPVAIEVAKVVTKMVAPAAFVDPLDKPAKAARKTKTPKPATAPKTGGKGATVLEMVKRKGGALASEMMAATGWLPHTLRAFLSRAKAEHGIVSERTPDGSRYSVKAG